MLVRSLNWIIIISEIEVFSYIQLLGSKPIDTIYNVWYTEWSMDRGAMFSVDSIDQSIAIYKA